MIIDGQNPVIQMDMISQIKHINIQEIKEEQEAQLIDNMKLVFNPGDINSRIIVQASGNLVYKTLSAQGDSSIWITYEIENIEKVLTKIGPIGQERSNDLKFGGLSSTQDLKIVSKNPIIFRLRANGRNINGYIEKVSYDFWYLQVQEFRF